MLEERLSDQAGRAGTTGNLNFFEIAMPQFDRADDALNLHDSMRHVLKKAKRQLVVSVRIKMEGGKVQVFEGYRAQHNIAQSWRD